MPDATLIVRAGEALYGERWQAPLARELGVHKDTVQDWRQGRSAPRPGVYADILGALRRRRAELDAIEAELAALEAGAE